VECTTSTSLAVAKARHGKELLVIENQIITENKLIAYTWTPEKEVKVVAQSLKMSITGATLLLDKPVLFSDDTIFVYKL